MLIECPSGKQKNLLDKAGHVKLADFGWANVMTDSVLRSTFCGILDYFVAEMIRGDGHHESIDMWQMGVLLYEMTIGESPLDASSQEQTCKLIFKCDLRFPSRTNPDAKDLVLELCKLKLCGAANSKTGQASQVSNQRF